MPSLAGRPRSGTRGPSRGTARRGTARRVAVAVGLDGACASARAASKRRRIDRVELAVAASRCASIAASTSSSGDALAVCGRARPARSASSVARSSLTSASSTRWSGVDGRAAVGPRAALSRAARRPGAARPRGRARRRAGRRSGGRASLPVQRHRHRRAGRVTLNGACTATNGAERASACHGSSGVGVDRAERQRRLGQRRREQQVEAVPPSSGAAHQDAMPAGPRVRAVDRAQVVDRARGRLPSSECAQVRRSTSSAVTGAADHAPQPRSRSAHDARRHHRVKCPIRSTSSSAAGAAGSTGWPSDSSRRPASSAAATHSASVTAMSPGCAGCAGRCAACRGRRRPRRRRARAGGGAVYGSPGMEPGEHVEDGGAVAHGA